ncbi:hypothetical protein QGN29_11805 [Temperatibacter marinus]|uniref:Flagellar protein FliL n=1 Tax=Temperatibacter marinus TaxID=1456591 RepID=A0AA52ECG5_9PROT|nr:hypothetical protein [Temperatibacter marinus]WND02236.1 hypothetical protein QGN29_11805 [Temperatibacter marinus]
MSDKDDDVGEDGGGSKILLILGIIIGIAAGGGGVFFFLGQQPQSANVEEVEEEEVPDPINYEFIEIDKMTAPVYVERRGKPYEAGSYLLDIRILVKPEHIGYVASLKLEMRQAFLSALYKNELMLDKSNRLDVTRASEVLTRAAKTVVNDKYIHNVVIHNSHRIP